MTAWPLDGDDFWDEEREHPDPEDEDGAEALTAAERNPSLCRQ
jgi:hypothetical protein